MNIRLPQAVLLLTAVLVVLSGCASTTTATVVSSSGGPTIQQAQQEPYAGPKKRIAVTAFEFKAASGSGDIGRGMSDMLSNALFNSNRFIVLERENIKEVIQEQDFGATGRVKRETAAPIGEIEGAELIIRGAVTEFEPKCKGGALLIVAAQQACVTINLRIVDAKTGRVVNATTVEGRSDTVGAGLVFATNPLPIGLGGWAKTPMETAIRNCIETAVQHITSSKL
ncbi:MAG: Curli production assembly/transport component CsgG [Proteobacteria bacterium]|nr:Curli production assembly/transport component CsgG [Pseudomonadota bacterium]MBS1246525.1 Curli production assembly/transport component CsgG [Pseudomonadota bacterium]